MLLKDVLAQKGGKVWSTKAEHSLQDAVKTLVENKIGALLVFDSNNKVVGIISERDVMRECHQNPEGWKDVAVENLMSKGVVMATPGDTVEYAMSAMTENRCRHLPVMQDGTLVGVVSIGDIVKCQLKEQKHQIQYLKDYIQGS